MHSGVALSLAPSMGEPGLLSPLYFRDTGSIWGNRPVNSGPSTPEGLQVGLIDGPTASLAASPTPEALTPVVLPRKVPPS